MYLELPLPFEITDFHVFVNQDFYKNLLKY